MNAISRWLWAWMAFVPIALWSSSSRADCLLDLRTAMCDGTATADSYVPRNGRVIASQSNILGSRFIYVELYWISDSDLAWFQKYQYSSLEPDVLFDENSPYVNEDLLDTESDPIEPIITNHSRFPCEYIDTTISDDPKVNFTVGSACASEFKSKVKYWTLARAKKSPYASGHFGIRMQRGRWVEWSQDVCSMQTGWFPWDTEPNPVTYPLCVFSCCESENNIIAVQQNAGLAPGCHGFTWSNDKYTSTRCVENDCGNGVDDDWDGLTDCADTDCARVSPCLPAQQTCFDNVKNQDEVSTDCGGVCAGVPGYCPMGPKGDGNYCGDATRNQDQTKVFHCANGIWDSNPVRNCGTAGCQKKGDCIPDDCYPSSSGGASGVGGALSTGGTTGALGSGGIHGSGGNATFVATGGTSNISSTAGSSGHGGAAGTGGAVILGGTAGVPGIGGTSGVLRCGNGIVESGEQCDLTTLNGQSCFTSGFATGMLKCQTTCSLDTSGCSGCAQTCAECRVCNQAKGVCDVASNGSTCSIGTCQGGTCQQPACDDTDGDHHGPGCEYSDDCNPTECLAWTGAQERIDVADNDCDGQHDDLGLVRYYRYFHDAGGSDFEHRFATASPGPGWELDGHWIDIIPTNFCTDPTYRPQSWDGTPLCTGPDAQGVVTLKAPCWSSPYAFVQLMECTNASSSWTIYITRDSNEFRQLGTGWTCLSDPLGYVATSAVTGNDGHYVRVTRRDCSAWTTSMWSTDTADGSPECTNVESWYAVRAD